MVDCNEVEKVCHTPIIQEGLLAQWAASCACLFLLGLQRKSYHQ